MFSATDIQGFNAALNKWGAHAGHLITEVRNAVLLYGADPEVFRNGVTRLEQRTETLSGVGGRAVAELYVIMSAFRAELVLSKNEQQQARFQEAEALKGELRKLVARLEARFPAVDAAVGGVAARTEAIAAATARQDPWWLRDQQRPQQTSGRQPVAHFALDVDADPSTATGQPPRRGPPGRPDWGGAR